LKNEIINNNISEFILKIENEIKKCHINSGNLGASSYNFAIELKYSVIDNLNYIKDLVGKEDYRFEMISDKISDEMLNCAITTFKSKTNDDIIDDEVRKILSFAEGFAVSDFAKKRVKENEADYLKALKSQQLDKILVKFFDALNKSMKLINQLNIDPFSVFSEFNSVFNDTIRFIGNKTDIQSEVKETVYNLSAGLFRQCAILLANSYTHYKNSKLILEIALKYVTNIELKEKLRNDLKIINLNSLTSVSDSDKNSHYNTFPESVSESKSESESFGNHEKYFLIYFIILIVLILIIANI
jgi:hypothetical protein